jgi:hypothetical protein
MPAGDDWTAAVADRMIRETILARERLRQSGVQPVGLVSGSGYPMPGQIAEQTFGPAADLRTGGAITSIRLRYGDASDSSAKIIEVTSDFTPECASCCPLEYELGRARHEYAALARGEREISGPPDVPSGPFSSSTGEILLDGKQHVIATTACGDYYAFQFEFKSSVHVTVVGRHQEPARLSFKQVDDLDPYFPRVDREYLRRQLREMRGSGAAEENN